MKAFKCRIGILLSLCGLLFGCTHVSSRPSSADIRHVFIIVLENKTFDDTFVNSAQDPYLRETLVPRGALLTEYYGTGHVSLDNYISMISGQAPTPDTANDCLSAGNGMLGNYSEVVETGMTADGQVIASTGCVYPSHVKTLADQMTEAGLTWKGYMEDMGNDPARESARCGHPRIGDNTDNTNVAEAPTADVPQGDAYATRHNPFMYFHSIIDAPACRKNVINLEVLKADLVEKSKTPNLAFITPNLCHDGHDGDGSGKPGSTCVDGKPGGLTSADAFLAEWVPRIMDSDAFKKDGLLIITFDESNYTLSEGKDQESGRTTVTAEFPGRSCCSQQPGPNLTHARPGIITLVDTDSLIERVVIQGYGGDRIGALLLSPFVKPGSTSSVPYNHYSLLRSMESLFGLSEYLGYAADNPSTEYKVSHFDTDPNVFGPNLSLTGNR